MAHVSGSAGNRGLQGLICFVLGRQIPHLLIGGLRVTMTWFSARCSIAVLRRLLSCRPLSAARWATMPDRQRRSGPCIGHARPVLKSSRQSRDQGGQTDEAEPVLRWRGLHVRRATMEAVEKFQAAPTLIQIFRRLLPCAGAF